MSVDGVFMILFINKYGCIFKYGAKKARGHNLKNISNKSNICFSWMIRYSFLKCPYSRYIKYNISSFDNFNLQEQIQGIPSSSATMSNS